MTNQQPPVHSQSFIDLVSGLKKSVPEVSVNEVYNLLNNPHNNNFILIDVREDEEWDNGHIPGALHLCKGIIERDIEKTVPNKNIKIALQCAGGSRSMIAAASLLKMGYTDVSSMAGGLRAWLSAGYSILK